MLISRYKGSCCLQKKVKNQQEVSIEKYLYNIFSDSINLDYNKKTINISTVCNLEKPLSNLASV